MKNEVNLSEIDLGNLFSMGDNYFFILRDVKYPFWRDTLQAWRDYIKSFTTETIDEILYSPICTIH